MFGMDLMASSAKWLSELGMDEMNMIHGCHMNSMAELSRAQDITASLPPLVAAPQSSLSSDTAYSSYTTDFVETRPVKLAKTNSLNSSITTHYDSIKQDPPSPPCTSQILSFDNLDIHKTPVFATNGAAPYDDRENTYYNPKIGSKRTHSLTRNLVNAQDHIMAERRRREKISQRFITLTSIVPGLKKMDKASVLGEAVRYVKQLQGRVNELEEQMAKKTVESVVLVRKFQVAASDKESLSSCGGDENSNGRSEAILPEIEVRVSDKDVLIRILFEKQRGLVVKVLSEIEKLHLSVVNSSVLPFGKSTLDMIIIAQKDPKYNIEVKDLARELRKGLLNM